jgi:hypothetical protein
MRTLIAIAITTSLITLYSTQARATHYFGGATMPNARIIMVDWEQNYPIGHRMPTSLHTAAADLYSAITRSTSVVTFLQQYNRPPSSPLGPFPFGAMVPYDDSTRSFVLTLSGTNSSKIFLHDADPANNGHDISDELRFQILAGRLPASDLDTLYVVHIPPQITVTADTGTLCQEFCGYHTYNAPDPVFGIGIRYAIVPDTSAGPCAGKCGLGTPEQNLQVIASHEILEAVTDPEPFTGWYLDEIGDPCSEGTRGAAMQSSIVNPATGQRVAFQRMWSEMNHSCVAVEPVALCCNDSYESGTYCYGVGAAEACPAYAGPSSLGRSSTQTIVPIVTGSVYSLSNRASSCTDWQGGIAVPASRACTLFTGGYQAAPGTSATICFEPPTVFPQFPNVVSVCVSRKPTVACPSGYTRRNPTECCQPLSSFNWIGGSLCSQSIGYNLLAN